MSKSSISRRDFNRLLLAVPVASAFPSALAAIGSEPIADAELIKAAKREGEVTWYTTLIVNQLVRPMAAAFEEKYGIRVKYSRANSSATAAKLLNEARARRVQASVFDGTQTAIPLMNAGIVEKWMPDSANMYPPQYKSDSGYWTASNLYFMTPAYNTSMLSKEEVPQTYEDLLDPKWKGKKMIWGDNSFSSGIGFIGNVLETMGEKKGMAYLDKLAQQDIASVNASARQVLNRVIQGEYPIALNIFNHHAAISARKGAPVDWIPMQPVMGAVSAVSLMKSAPAPNAGKLLIDFILSTQGQEIFKKALYLPSLPSVSPTIPTLEPQRGNFEVNEISPQQLYTGIRSKWSQIFEEKFL